MLASLFVWACCCAVVSVGRPVCRLVCRFVCVQEACVCVRVCLVNVCVAVRLLCSVGVCVCVRVGASANVCACGCACTLQCWCDVLCVRVHSFVCARLVCVVVVSGVWACVRDCVCMYVWHAVVACVVG